MGKHSFDEKETKRKRNEQDDYEALKRLREEEKNKTKTTVKREEYEEDYDDDDDYEEGKSKKGIVVLIILLLLICAGVGGYFGYKYYSSKQNNNQNNEGTTEAMAEEPAVVVPEKQVQIYNGDQRPIACMIDNHKDAWPQFSINSAFTVYEIIVEGGETRLMALFQNKDLNVGPMRSSRHYFLDYALENDAIYAHIGWSPQAQKDIPALGVNNINGLYFDTGRAYKEGDVFWRIYGNYVAPHNSISNTTAIRNAAAANGYRTTTSQSSVLHYVTDEVTLEDKTDAVAASDVIIPFSTLQKVEFKYDATTQRYTRYARGIVQKDATTGENITTKNIIITFAENYTLSDGQNKGRQGLKNIGTQKGYYITNGKAIPITCTKNSRAEKTIYKDASGNVIDVNDGNTFIEICPLNAAVSIQ